MPSDTVPDDVDGEQVAIRTIELPWSEMRNIAAGEPHFVDAGEELIVVVRDTQAEDVIAAFDETLDDLEVRGDA